MNRHLKCINWVFCVFAAFGPATAAGQKNLPAGAPPAAREHAVELRIAARKPVGGVRTVRVTRADTVTLDIRSDEALGVHVHGYGNEARVDPGTPTRLRFLADAVGRFAVTAHLPGAGGRRHGPEPTLLYLEVHPE